MSPPPDAATHAAAGPALLPGGRTRRRLEPHVFDCASLWRHDRPLLEVLARDYGQLRLQGAVGSYGWLLKYDQQPAARAHRIETLGDYLAAFADPVARDLPYLMHLAINRHLPRLRDSFESPPEFRPNWVTSPRLDRLGGPELFLGTAGSGFGPFHQDHAAVHVGFWQIEGEKQFFLFPPEDAPYLYTYAGAQYPRQLRNSRVKAVEYRDFARFPLIAHARPRVLVLRAGQCLFLPANWWHSTINLTRSVSYSIRIVNHTNVLATLGEYAGGLPRAVRRLLGRR
jgi:hypothetical protein